jgi:hypothetical protein
MEINYTTITFTPDEFQARLTNTAHNTICYLYDQGHISAEQSKELLETIVVVPVANNSLFGRLRERLFGEQKDKTISKYIVTQI